MIDPKKLEEWEALARGDGRTSMLNESLRVLLAEREEMLAVLREVEWSALVNVADEVPIEEAQACPLCLAIQRTGHSPDCRLAALLR